MQLCLFKKYHYNYMSSDQQKIINDVYFDRSGFGSLNTTLEDSRKKTNQLLWMMSDNSSKIMLKSRRSPVASIPL